MLGKKELKPKIVVTGDSVECPVTGCERYVERQTHHFRREERFQCPIHRIIISPTTFEYPDPVDNSLWGSQADLDLLRKINTVKRECRMARDNSEDALTWNVFRYLQTADQLTGLLSWLTGRDEEQTELIYWSYSQKENGSWTMLNTARREFGEHLQRSSEPDLIAVTSRALFFLEAKLTATNNTIPGNPDNLKKYLTGGRDWVKQVIKSDFDTVAIRAKKYELFRFWLLGSWMAAQMGLDFYLVNIVPSARETDIEARFVPHVRLTGSRQFRRLSWEEICARVARHAPDGEESRRLVTYLQDKTTGYNRSGELQMAFSGINY
jgi:hypothetical protein